MTLCQSKKGSTLHVHLQELNHPQWKAEDVASESEVNARIKSHQTRGLLL